MTLVCFTSSAPALHSTTDGRRPSLQPRRLKKLSSLDYCIQSPWRSFPTFWWTDSTTCSKGYEDDNSGKRTYQDKNQPRYPGYDWQNVQVQTCQRYRRVVKE